MKKGLEASYTVEAAFIFPLVFALLYGIVFLGFYLHDCTIMEQCAWEGAFFGAGQIREVTEDEIEEYIEERLEDRLLISGIERRKVTAEGGTVVAELSGKSSVPGFMEALIGYRQKKGIAVKRTVSYPRAPGYVRLGLAVREQLQGLWGQEEN